MWSNKKKGKKQYKLSYKWVPIPFTGEAVRAHVLIAYKKDGKIADIVVAESRKMLKNDGWVKA